MTVLTNEKKRALDFIEAYKKRMVEISQKIWTFAELGLEEYRSSALLMEELERYGFSIEKAVAGMPTAFVGTFGEGKPVIGILAEYDALPGLSNHPVPYRSPILEGSPGHGCGHNLFGTASVASAIALSQVMEKFHLSGTVKLFGTPAEETCIGKAYMAREFCFEGIDVFLDWHPEEASRARYTTCNAYTSVKFRFTGISAHGNRPWNGRSALEGAELMGVAVNYMRGHLHPGETSEGAATINYTYTLCGQYPNVIPDLAEVWYVYRIPTHEALETVHQRILRCAQGAALATETDVAVNVLTGTHELIPNMSLAHLIHQNLELIGPPPFDQEDERFAKELQRSYKKEELGLSSSLDTPSGGSQSVTDSAEASWFAPYGVVHIACRPRGIASHSWGANASYGMTIGQKGMVVAAKTLGLTGVDLLTFSQLLNEAQDEFRERMRGKMFKSALPMGQKPPLPDLL
ncbi:MAG TPA: amidohydrolase [Thermodesulfobacteriota bacterium]|nr:amidohydrolase [Thermodesulfobacteriota bacterium]